MIIGKLAVILSAQTAKFSAGMKEAATQLTTFDSSVNKLGKNMSRMGRRMTLMFTLPVVAAVGAAVKKFASFEEAMRNVNVIAKMSDAQFEKMSKTVLDLSVKFGKKGVEVAEALYDINSATIFGADAMKVLNHALEGSVAGQANLRIATRSVIGVLRAYSLGVEHAADVNDVMFRTVERGLVTYQELANNVGVTVATAAAAKIPFEHVGAAIATITRGGIHARIAFTSLNNAILKMIHGSGAMNTIAKKYGHENMAAMLATRGLGQAVQILTKETGGNAKKMQELGFNIRAVRSIWSLARDEGRAFGEDLELIGTRAGRAGATTRAFKEQTRALAFKLRQLKSEIGKLAIEFGKSLAGSVVKATKKIKLLIKSFNDLTDAQRLAKVKMLLLTAAIPVLLWGIGTLINSIIALGVAITFLAAHPVVLAITGLTLFGYTIYKLFKGIKETDVVMEHLGKTTKSTGILFKKWSFFGGKSMADLSGFTEALKKAKAVKAAAKAASAVRAGAGVPTKEFAGAFQRGSEEAYKVLIRGGGRAGAETIPKQQLVAAKQTAVNTKKAVLGLDKLREYGYDTKRFWEDISDNATAPAYEIPM